MAGHGLRAVAGHPGDDHVFGVKPSASGRADHGPLPSTSTAPAEPDTVGDALTVVVITHDRRAELLHTLGLLTELPERPPVIVVDNASTDGTAEAVEQDFPTVTLIRADRNLGAVGRNLAARIATTRHLAFCDDDTWWEPGSLARGVEILDAHPELAVATATILVEPDGRVDPICEELRSSPLPRRAGVPGHPLISFLAGVSLLRRRAFLDAGGFSSRLWLGGEEELLASDLLRAGWQLGHLPELIAHHRPSRARDAHRRRRLGIRNSLWFTWLRRSWRDALRHTVRLLRALPRDRHSLGGVMDAVRGVPWVLRNRDPLPPELEARYRLLEDDQVNGPNRRYVS